MNEQKKKRMTIEKCRVNRGISEKGEDGEIRERELEK